MRQWRANKHHGELQGKAAPASENGKHMRPQNQEAAGLCTDVPTGVL